MIVLRKAAALLAAFALLAAACGGSDASSCEGIADEGIDLVQELINELEGMSLEDLAAGEPEQMVDFEGDFADLEQRAEDVGCSDDEMEALFRDRVEDLSASNEIGELFLEGFRSEF